MTIVDRPFVAFASACCKTSFGLTYSTEGLAHAYFGTGSGYLPAQCLHYGRQAHWLLRQAEGSSDLLQAFEQLLCAVSEKRDLPVPPSTVSRT